MAFSFLALLSPSNTVLPYFSFKVPAGFPSPAGDHLEQEISLDELLELRTPHTYLVRVDGDSMQGAGIYSGDLLVVDRSSDAITGDIVIAAVNSEPMVKRLGKIGQTTALLSENPSFAPRFILEGDELVIWGVVRYSVRSHDHHG